LTVKAIFDACGSDVTDYDTFLRGVPRWTVVECSPLTDADCLEGALKLAHVELCPNIRKCFELLLVMPVSTSTAERSFSTMKRVKSYLRNSMTAERISGLALMNIYKANMKFQQNKSLLAENQGAGFFCLRQHHKNVSTASSINSV